MASTGNMQAPPKDDGNIARLRVLYKEEIDEFRFDFDATDIDKDGFIAGEELKPMLKLQLERDPTDQEVAAMMTEFDINKDGKISFDEYMTTMCGEGWTQDAPAAREKPIKWLVPVDASANAVNAFHYACRLLQKGDTITCFHVTNPGRYPDMAAMFHPDAIKAAFELESIKADINMTHQMTFVCEEKSDSAGKKIREMIRDYAEYHCDVICLGSFGSKKQKDAEADFRCIGTTSALVTQGCKATCIIVDRRCPELALKNQRRFFVPVDGSDLAHEAYLKATEFLKAGDYMQVVYVETGSSFGGDLVSAYAHDLFTRKIKGSVKVDASLAKEASPAGATIAAKILEIAEGGEVGDDFGMADLIVMGSNGLSAMHPAPNDHYEEYVKEKRDAHKKGSVASKVLDDARTAVMVVTVDSLLGGLDFTTRLGKIHEFKAKWAAAKAAQ